MAKRIPVWRKDQKLELLNPSIPCNLSNDNGAKDHAPVIITTIARDAQTTVQIKVGSAMLQLKRGKALFLPQLRRGAVSFVSL